MQGLSALHPRWSNQYLKLDLALKTERLDSSTPFLDGALAVHTRSRGVSPTSTPALLVGPVVTSPCEGIGRHCLRKIVTPEHQ